jgi:hypothetical protein
MDDPVDERTRGKLDLSDALSLIVSVVIVLGSLALDAGGVWNLPQEVKLSLILGAGAVLLGEKVSKAVSN